MVYFKYRSLENWQFLLDILINSRLYAASFESLNDPMEGLFRYDLGMRDLHLIDKIVQQKQALKICSLSSSSDNHLMWSYYANGHQGVVIELELNAPFNARPIDYNGIGHFNDFVVFGDNETIAREILSRKERFWQHEQEYRVITTDSFVPIIVKRVIIGSKVEANTKALLEKLLLKLGISMSSL